jgi:hypothetical protein
VQDAKPVGLDGVQVAFDDERVVCDAGVMVVATLVLPLGIEALAGELVRLRRDLSGECGAQGDGTRLRDGARRRQHR